MDMPPLSVVRALLEVDQRDVAAYRLRVSFDDVNTTIVHRDLYRRRVQRRSHFLSIHFSLAFCYASCHSSWLFGELLARLFPQLYNDGCTCPRQAAPTVVSPAGTSTPYSLK